MSDVTFTIPLGVKFVGIRPVFWTVVNQNYREFNASSLRNGDIANSHCLRTVALSPAEW